MQIIVSFSNSYDTGSVEFKFLCIVTTGCFQSRLVLGEKWYNFDQVNEFCISQGSAVTFFKCGEQMHNRFLRFLQNYVYQNY